MSQSFVGMDIASTVSEGRATRVFYQGKRYMCYGGVVGVDGQSSEVGNFPGKVQQVFRAEGLCSVPVIQRLFPGCNAVVSNE